ncbi:hypothetical protein P7H55_09650 [Vagococcus lutrae]|uniref:hypothetical protein n=1 Tax=Vagococcus lutrae TaxID=81947 RepID=UPI0028919E9B|nr:hypothetical protein [Vagococcus lutrae]MDT2818099.1 hypothetical protein [Vagococcus lutrae]
MSLGVNALYLISTLPKEQKQEEISNDLTLSHLDIDKDFANKFKKAAKGLTILPMLAEQHYTLSPHYPKNEQTSKG